MAIINGTSGNDVLDDLTRLRVLDTVDLTSTVASDRGTSTSSFSLAPISPLNLTSPSLTSTIFTPVDRGTDDTIYAGAGHDSISIYNGNDTVYGGQGSDVAFDRGTGNDTFFGEAGNDYFVVGKGNDTFNGGDGTDRVSYELSEQIVALDLQTGFAISEGIDTLISVEDARGGIGNDTLLGSDVANHLIGADGNDRLDGRYGNDLLEGGVGNDKLIGGYGSDTLQGGLGDDVLIASTEDSRAYQRGDGTNVLVGGAGDDVMTGGMRRGYYPGAGSGVDSFVFTSKSDIFHYDTITNFQQGLDKIDLRGIDARPDQAGNQAFTFDATPDGRAEELADALNDFGNLVGSTDPGPFIRGDTGEVEYRHQGGKTYVYLSYADEETDVSIVLNGTIDLKASDFLL